ncbi:MAG: hypothetical protein Q4G16_00820 [Cruoricaptor ignavus]|nr:hypothetical protein [Cruoricaptor ignavus]
MNKQRLVYFIPPLGEHPAHANNTNDTADNFFVTLLRNEYVTGNTIPTPNKKSK